MELVSIIMPAYNAEKTIESAVESVLAQTYSNFEVIIINDGSKDKTENICLKLAQQDSRIKVVTTVNLGVSNARNVGINHAQGFYIAFLDSDDRMEKNMLEKMVSFMLEKKNISMVCCGYIVVNSTQEVLFSKIPKKLTGNANKEYNKIEELQECACFNSLWNKMFLASAIRDFNIRMDTSITMGEDLLFVIDYIRHMGGIINIIPEGLYKYTLSNNGLQATFEGNSRLRLNQLKCIRQLYIDKQYPQNGYYLEALRTIYTTLLENYSSIDRIKKILLSDVCAELKKKKVNCSGKYKILLLLIKIGNVQLIHFSVYWFKLLKRFTGKSFEWKA